jgi:hypothetical protein
MFKPVLNIQELLDAQLRDPTLLLTWQRSWINLMSIRPFLPEPGDADTVIDLGCGSGRMSIMLHNHWDSTGHFYLVDGNNAGEQLDTSKWGVHTASATDSFYNKLDVTKAFCLENGMSQVKTHFVEIPENKDWSLPPADPDRPVQERANVMISMYAVGTHYPISMYEAVYPKVLYPGATFIFTKDKRTGPIPDYFEVVDSVEDDWRKFAKDARTRKSRNRIVVAKYEP